MPVHSLLGESGEGTATTSMARLSRRTGSGNIHTLAPSSRYRRRLPAMFRSLSYPDYLTFWLGALVSNTGGWIQTVAQGWLVLLLTSSPFYLGLVGFAGMVPNLFFSLVGGLLADRLDRKRVLIAAQVLSMAAAAGIGLLTALGIIQIWHIVGLAFIGGLAMALSFPSWQSVVSDLVAEEDLINAVALNSAQFNLTRILGPTIGGFLIGWIGVVGCFFANAVSYLAVIYAVWRIQLPRRNPSQLATDGILSSLREGFSLVRSSRSLQRVLIMGAGFTLFSMPYLTFMPVFARDILNAGAEGLGMLMAAAGIGAFAGSLLVAGQQESQRAVRMVAISPLVMSAGLIAFALSTNFLISSAVLLVVGMSMTAFMSSAATLVQLWTPAPLRGRVLSIYNTVVFGLMPVGSLQAGAVASVIGVPTTLLVGALLSSAIVISAQTLSGPQARRGL
jgi:MFS family permease